MNKSGRSGLTFLAALGALLLSSCLSGDRLAGSSTEAGNAGGKLSLSDGNPAAGVTVTLVARSYLPDTLAIGSADVPGSYYRTRTGKEGRFSFKDVIPGEYRVMAIGGGRGAMAESVKVEAGLDTVFVERVLKPLGGIRGFAKLVGSNAKPRLFVRPRATVKQPPVADAQGAFRLDSLPEGEYELVPACLSCQPSLRSYRVSVTEGRETIMNDTLELHPEYFQEFPDSGALVLRDGYLPYRIVGKTNRGQEDSIRPMRVEWTWNGSPLASRNVITPEGVAETGAILDSTLFADAREGLLRLVLVFADTTVAREWRVRLDASDPIWPRSVLEADSVEKVAGPVASHLWRFRVKRSMPVDAADLVFWGLDPGGEDAKGVPLPEWVELTVDPGDQAMLTGTGPAGLTLILIPDAQSGGRAFRPRRDERLEDFHNIRFLEKVRHLNRSHLGPGDTLLPTFLPGQVLLDRNRGRGVQQRYRVDSAGSVEELLGALPIDAPPLLFYRSGPAALGYVWDTPLRGAAQALAVTREGVATRFDSAAGFRRTLPASEIAALEELLAPLSLGKPAFADTHGLAGDGSLAYLRFGARGLFQSPGKDRSIDSLLTAFGAWMMRNGLEDESGFPFTAGVSRYLGYQEDSAGMRITGDTLVQESALDPDGIQVREYLSEGSPSRVAGDTAVFAYRLAREADSLVALSGPEAVTSRLFGKIDGRLAVFAVAGLPVVSPDFNLGLPVLGSGEQLLAGRMEGAVEALGRSLESPRVFLDGRSIADGRQGTGFLYTPDRGLEGAWRFGGRIGLVKAWGRE